ncbi:amidohydrolase family protein [Streptomyces sp. SID14478]|uniref:metal-dependent hydrolase family protein n=1 Tax=Streptomyces sp. SID14478 TaxID=2706073 RepID=UPI0013DFD463|nr:amidohydrolase family protein [Streptomyces sp. SID14478]NEB81944.1 amidohydrolase family protein [Streptomyces sp. SID14478]
MTDGQDLLLIADRSWDGVSDQVSGHTELLVRDGRIERIGPTVPRSAAPGAQVVELGDHTLLPGFIDCHVHTTMNPADVLGPAVSTSPAMVALNSLPVLRTVLDHGFTTVRDMACFTADPITVHLARAIARGLVTGPRMIVAPHLISARGAHGDFSTLLSPALGVELVAVADGPDEIRTAVRRDIRSGADWIKFGATGGFGSPSDDPGQATYSQEEMNALVGAAADLGIPCTPHAYGDEGVRRAVLAGVRSVEHGNLASAQTLQLMQDRGVFLVPTQFMVDDALEHLDEDTYWQGKTPEERTKFRAYKDRLMECARNLADSEVKVAFGTDIGMFPHEQAWREFPTMVKLGLSPARALRAATSVAADLLDRSDLGRLAPGCTADVIAVPGDPMDDITVTGQVAFVLQGGLVHARPAADDGAGT